MTNGANQVVNGKSFEYALASQYAACLNKNGVKTELVRNAALEVAENYFNLQTEDAKERFCLASIKTIDTIVKLEPGLTMPKNSEDILRIALASDAEGQDGDVRDLVFSRSVSHWEVGFSAKNNHEAVKHSRLSHSADFGTNWLGVPCSHAYWDAIRPIFQRLQELKAKDARWSDIPDKAQSVYLPVLTAFRKELLRINETEEDIPRILNKTPNWQVPILQDHQG